MLTNSQRTSYFPLLSHEYSELSQNTICTMASHQRRRSSIDRASVKSILTPSTEQSAADPPSPHIGMSPNRPQFPMAPPARPTVGHSRTQSFTPRRPNRLSLSFPVAAGIAPYSNESMRHTPTSSDTHSFPSTPGDAPVTSPNDPAGFLVALASQERKVFELKEELQKAETELIKLKRQWASHETHKKRAEIRHLEQLQPLQTVMADGSSAEESPTATQQSMDIDKRKALLNNLNIPKETRRKFSGAHTRTLSLLSPERSNYAQPFPFPAVQESVENTAMPRSTTMPDTSQGLTKVNTSRARHSYQGGVTHNAKLIAEDVKAGLWTFLEDLRQATVGEEGVNGTTNRAGLDPMKGPAKKGSRGSLRGNDKTRRGQSPRGSPQPKNWNAAMGDGPSLLDVVEVSGLPVNKSLAPKRKVSKPISLTAPAIDELDDGWSNWDSPAPKSPRWSGSTTVSDDPPTPSNGSSDGRSVKVHDQSRDGFETPSKVPRDEIQWPALDKLTPGNLKRTVSTIMQEWERSLTPPPASHQNLLLNSNQSESSCVPANESAEIDEARRRSTQDELVMMSR